MTGTHQGDLPGLPATGKPFSVRGSTIFEIAADMICAVRDYWDLATLLTWTLRLMEARMMLLGCPAYLDDEGTVRCGLPAEVRCRFTMHSTDGPLESAMIRCPAGHWFNGPIESLTWESSPKQSPPVPRRTAAGQ